MIMEEYKKIIQNYLQSLFDEYKSHPSYSSYSSKIWDSMRYTTLLDAKRIRAIMCLELGKIFKIEEDILYPLSSSIEIMHAYSLIHDDMPCMDNDDLRRGKPSNHKVFGEAIALLAGDGLICFGAQILIDKLKDKLDPKVLLEIISDYHSCAGATGLIAGQVADMEAQNKKTDIENLKYIHNYKTASLFNYSVKIVSKVALNRNIINENEYKKLEQFSLNFGLLFQIYDDIIDYTLSDKELGKTAHKDLEADKLTYVSAYGLEEAKNIFNSLKNESYDILNEIRIKSEIFDEIFHLLDRRVN